MKIFDEAAQHSPERLAVGRRSREIVCRKVAFSLSPFEMTERFGERSFRYRQVPSKRSVCTLLEALFDIGGYGIRRIGDLVSQFPIFAQPGSAQNRRNYVAKGHRFGI